MWQYDYSGRCRVVTLQILVTWPTTGKIALQILVTFSFKTAVVARDTRGNVDTGSRALRTI